MGKKFKVLRSEVVYQGPAFDVRHDRLEIAPGQEIVRSVVVHPGAVVIVPKTASGKLLLINQYRHPVGATVLEFPAGTLEAGEKPLTAAKREIREETGYAANRWQEMGILYPTPGFCDEVQYLFVAEDLTHSPAKGDEDEVIEVVELTSAEVEKRIDAGELIDAKSISAFTKAKIKGWI